MEKVSDVSVIGLGRLGSTLTRALLENDIPVASIYNRTPKKAERLAKENSISFNGTFPADYKELGELIFLTVSDSAIRPTAEKLSSLSDDFNGKIIVHCSGNETSELLDSLSEKNAYTAAFHPLQTFKPASGTDCFKGIYFSIEGDKKSKKILENIAKYLGAQSVNVTKKAKSYLHIAAVVASNYLLALLDASIEIGRLGQFDEEQIRKALLPLIFTTLQNTKDQSVARVLTGPIARGDIHTVKKHMELLNTDSELYSLYKMLGKRTLKIAQKSGSLDEDVVDSLGSLLDE